MKKINVPLFVVGFLLVMAFVIPAALAPVQTSALIGSLYSFMTRDLAWLCFGCYLVFLAFPIYFAFSKYGRIRLGGKDAKPEYTNFEYISMNVCSALAAGVVTFGFTEWMYYVTATPFHVTPGSIEAYEFASAYGMFHWGITMWPLYIMPGIAIGYMYYNKNSGAFTVSAAMGDVTKKRPWLGWILDAIAAFHMASGVCTTVGLGTPVIAQLFASLTGMEISFAMQLSVIGVFMIFLVIFATTPIKKGMAAISKFNIWLGVVLLALVLILGPTNFILNTTYQAAGTNISHIIDMSFFTDSMGDGVLSGDWTAFYLVWYVGLAYKTGIWIAKTSKGRTFKEIFICVGVWTSIACWATFGILGNYALDLEVNGGVPYSKMIGEMGQSGVIADIVSHLPMAGLFMAGFMVLLFLNIATSVTSSVATGALFTSKNLAQDEEPNAGFKLIWIVLCFAIPVAFLIIEKATGVAALGIIKNFTTIMSIPFAFMGLALIWYFMKVFKKDEKDGLFDAELNGK